MVRLQLANDRMSLYGYDFTCLLLYKFSYVCPYVLAMLVVVAYTDCQLGACLICTVQFYM